MTDADEDGNLDNLLLQSVRDGDQSMVKELINKGANVDFVEKNESHSKRSVLHCAVLGHNKVIAEILHNEGANPCLIDSANKWTPLDYAIQYGCDEGDFEMADLLLENGGIISAKAFVDKALKKYWTAKLHFKCEDDDIEYQKFISYASKIKWTPNNIWKYQQVHGTPLHLLASTGHKDLVLKMVQCGVDVNIQDMDKRTPLLLAMKSGKYKTVKILLESGANPNIRASSRLNDNPFHLALYQNQSEIALLMMQHGADVKIHSIDIMNQRTFPLHLATMRNNQAIVKELLKHGACDCVRNLDGMIPLEVTMSQNDMNIFKTFLYHYS